MDSTFLTGSASRGRQSQKRVSVGFNLSFKSGVILGLLAGLLLAVIYLGVWGYIPYLISDLKYLFNG